MKPCYSNEYVTCGLTCAEKLCKKGSNPNNCNVSACSVVFSEKKNFHLLELSTVIVNRSLQGRISVAKYAVMLPRLLVSCVKADPNSAGIISAGRRANKLP